MWWLLGFILVKVLLVGGWLIWRERQRRAVR
jgi:hypothetical protein